jgi:hypothetical protein
MLRPMETRYALQEHYQHIQQEMVAGQMFERQIASTLSGGLTYLTQAARSVLRALSAWSSLRRQAPSPRA